MLLLYPTYILKNCHGRLQYSSNDWKNFTVPRSKFMFYCVHRFNLRQELVSCPISSRYTVTNHAIALTPDKLPRTTYATHLQAGPRRRDMGPGPVRNVGASPFLERHKIYGYI
jgi:hypothetical protein